MLLCCKLNPDIIRIFSLPHESFSKAEIGSQHLTSHTPCFTAVIVTVTVFHIPYGLWGKISTPLEAWALDVSETARSSQHDCLLSMHLSETKLYLLRLVDVWQILTLEIFTSCKDCRLKFSSKETFLVQPSRELWVVCENWGAFWGSLSEKPRGVAWVRL